MIQALLDLAGAIELPRLRWLIACGEAFPPDLCRRWMARFPEIRVLNAYGPAECSDDVSYYEVPAPPAGTDTVVPVGRPVDNTRLYLLDARLDLVPVGVPGEICVAGIQVGRGYLHRPELTAEKFIPNPFIEALGSRPQALGDESLEPSAYSLAPEFLEPSAYSLEPSSSSRLYRTGDLGRYRADGTIEFLGRIDHQVKIRGFRIEPGEIEAQLLKAPRVEQALVVARGDGRGGKRLVAYVVGQGAGSELEDELRAWLGARLPNYMVPSAFVRLGAMPLGPNGKIDRKALPEPDRAARREDLYVAPGNPTEEILAGIWKEVLGVERVGVRDGFFELGGHSLLAVQVLARVRSAFGIDIPLGRLFEAATVEQLALAVEEFLIGQLDGLSEEEALALLESDD
jgi:acyl-CoA synthetase (AMP-forming)/AMP-acid ligase II/acyl carrier protein